MPTYRGKLPRGPLSLERRGAGLNVTCLDRRCCVVWGKCGTPLRRPNSAPIRVYLKRWQVQVCVNDTCRYIGVIPLERWSVMTAAMSKTSRTPAA
jgi:hypothetical protein